MITNELRRAFKFFLPKHGCVSHRTTVAMRMARAELAAKEAGLWFQWEHDPDADWSWMSEEEMAEEHEVEGCLCRDEEGSVLASLGGIFDADSDYRRIVEAELAMEALARLEVPNYSI